MLEALVARYEDECRRGKVSKEGWEKSRVSFALVLSSGGKLLEILPLRDENKHPQILEVPLGEVKTVNVLSHFLCETAPYFLGIGEKEKMQPVQECFEVAASYHTTILKDVESDAAQAVVKFFQTWKEQKDTPKAKSILSLFVEEMMSGGRLVFRYDGRYVHEDPVIREAWEKIYRKGNGKGKRRCLVTGEMSPYAVKHMKIQGVKGAQPSGGVLVSFNESADESYGHDGEKGGNAPVSERAAFAYGTALNMLLADCRHKKIIADTTVVYWASKANEAAQDVFCIMCLDEAGNMTDASLNDIMQKVKNGNAIDYCGVNIPYENPFYILGISPNDARLSVRFFLQGSFGDFIKNVALHIEHMEIVRPHWEKRSYISILQLVEELAGSKVTRKNSLSQPRNNKKIDDMPKALASLASSLLSSVIKGKGYPTTAFDRMIHRIRFSKRKIKVSWQCAGFLKAYLIRNKGRMIAVALDENSTDIAYLLGRWFAVLEWIQESASSARWDEKDGGESKDDGNDDYDNDGEAKDKDESALNATIRDRFFDAMCGTPARVFPTVARLSMHHLKKLPKGRQVKFEKRIISILEKVDMDGIPAMFNKEEQSMFILGYYHQRQKRYEKKEGNVNGGNN